MNEAKANRPADDRRAFPRYPVTTRMSLAVEGESIGEPIGIGEPTDISLGGLRVRHLPPGSNVRLGDRLGMLLIGEDNALSLHGEVVHYGVDEGLGVKFQPLSIVEQGRIGILLQRLQ